MHLTCLSRWKSRSLLVLFLALPLNTIAYGINQENALAQNIKRTGTSAPAIAAPAATTTPAQHAACKAKKTSTTTAPPMPSCSLQNEDPDQGINERGCVCGTRTLPIIQVPTASATDPAQSCAYTAWPSASVSNPISIETQIYTSNCHICTLVGGIADTPDCSQSIKGCTTTAAATATKTAGPPGTTFAVFLSNNTVPVGIEDELNDGADLRNTMYSQLHAFCPDGGPSCDSTKDATIDKIPTVVDGGDEYETLKFVISDSNYTSTVNRDRMLAAAVATWQQAVSKNCKEVEYHAEADETISGCGQGPVSWRRALGKRVPTPIGPGDNGPPTRTCGYAANLCSGPDHICKLYPARVLSVFVLTMNP